MKVLSIGEILWDVIGEREFLGGAPLNVCANLQRCGDRAWLVSAVGNDRRGATALEAMAELGLNTQFIQTTPHRPTGSAHVRHDANGEPAFEIVRPAAFDELDLHPASLAELQKLKPDWLYMGTLFQTEPAMEALVHSLVEQLPGVRCFYDMNLRQGHWNLALVERLCNSACVLKLNEIEAQKLSALSRISSLGAYSLETFCMAWSERFRIDVVCVTLGPDGCCIYADGKLERFAGCAVTVRDTIGAGDAFAAAFLHGYQRRWSIARCASFANALGALVAGRSGATPAWSVAEWETLAQGGGQL